MEAPTTLAEALSAAGFSTWGFVDGGKVRRRFGFAQGFDEYQDRRVGVRRLIKRAQRWIGTHSERPFFLFLHTYEIHTPYKSPREYVELYGDPDYKGRFVPNTHYFRRVEGEGRTMGSRELHEVIARYDAGIRLTDEALGSFFAWLEERGLLADSLVVIVSDHGEEFLEHGRLGHQQLHLDPNLRVPLLFHGPGLRPSVVKQTVELNDVVPTILAVLGLPPLPGALGRSLAPLLYGGQAQVSGVAYSENGGLPGQQTLIGGRYQLLLDRESGRGRLFDLQAGSDAKRDISSERPGVVKMMTTELNRRRKASYRSHIRYRKQRASATPVAPMREEVRRELEALGYLEP